MYVASFCIMLAALAATSCSTNTYSVRRKASNADQFLYDIDLTYLDEETLVERFTEKNNPFISPQAYDKSKRITAFDLVIENRSPEGMAIRIAQETITLYSGSKSFTARNQFRLSRFWENQLQGSDLGRKYQGSSASKMQYVIGQNMFENTTTIQSGDQKSGILVFQGNIQNWGEVELRIPIFTDRDEFIGEYIEAYEF
jgi:hypothetical protein